ncbi:flagellar assembly protein FliH [Spirochaetia bacterium 38H-sp]|uniref:Flagellar assembly protein FliH n=1 Tax=Rarispira pelagica TaxID=3141764 RepID=A0ABU9UES2_9SPIR
MAKHIFKSNEIVPLKTKMSLANPEIKEHAKQEIQSPLEADVKDIQIPDISAIVKEAEEFKANWEKEKEAMISTARAEADRIISEAEKIAFEEVKKRNEEAARIKAEAAKEAEKIVSDAQDRVNKLIEEAKAKADEIKEAAREEGYREGREEGYREGREEALKIVERLKTVITRVVGERARIMEESEAQIVQLVLLIAKKVIKVLSENQKNIVVNNVVQALRKLKTKSDVVIRVNIDDLDVASEHIQDIIEKIEELGNVTVIEDSSVDRGGCIIETDFGDIDARIATQLGEIEERILETIPIKVVSKKQENE